LLASPSFLNLFGIENYIYITDIQQVYRIHLYSLVATLTSVSRPDMTHHSHPASILPMRAIHDGAIETPPRAPSPVHRFGTRAVHVGSHIDPHTGAVIAPV
jgi:hypothetical protein